MQVFVVGTGNKSIDEAVKKLGQIDRDISEELKSQAELTAKIESTEDAAKKARLEVTLKTIEQEISNLKAAKEKIGVRPATEEERRAALSAIPNMDERRRLAPGYLNPAKCWVKTK